MARYIVQLRRGTTTQWENYEKDPNHLIPQAGELVVEYDEKYENIPRLKIGDGNTEYSRLPFLSVDSFVLPTHGCIELSHSGWKEENGRYYQEVDVKNAVITSNSKIDLQPSAEQLAIFHNKDLAFVVENDNCKVRVYCVGQVPQNDYTIQATVTEVVING